jgi:undecaprenyl-diphosphatase
MTMFWVMLVLGIVEGLTEFLPISSTGHLIIVADFLNSAGRREEVFQVFIVFIQLGAILSVVWEYRVRFRELALEFPRSRRARGFCFRLLLAFVPAAVLGLLLHDIMVRWLFSPVTVAVALIVGAVLILIVEGLALEARTHDTDSVSWKQALGIGMAQCLALWPGFSRSAATIIGGLSAGLDRRTATEFSFFLAVPTMFAATFYKLYKDYRWLEPGDAVWLCMGVFVSFLVAWGSIRWLLRYVATHSFKVFAWYRLAVGVILLLLLART